MRQDAETPGAAASPPATFAPTAEVPPNDAESAAAIAVYRALGKPVNFHFEKTLLQDVVTALSRDFKIPVGLDPRIQDVYRQFDELSITADLQGVKLQTALDFMLKQHDLAWIVRDDGLLITSSDFVFEPRLRVYPVQDLLEFSEDFDDQLLVELVSCFVSPESWPARGVPYMPVVRGQFICPLPYRIHLEAQQLFGMIRQALRQQTEASPARRYATIKPNATAAQKFDLALAKVADADFQGASLSKVVAWLKQTMAQPVVVDPEAFAGGGQPLITYKRQNVTVRAILDGMLAEHDLSWYLLDDLLVINHRELARNQTEVRIYPLGDLVEDNYATLDEGPVSELVELAVYYDPWDHSAVTGAAVKLPGHLLLLLQTIEGHEQFETVLAQLRHKAPGENQIPAVIKPGQDFRLQVFALPSFIDAQAMLPAIRETFEPDRWQSPQQPAGQEPLLEAMPQRLVVRQDGHLVELIGDLVDQTNAFDQWTVSLDGSARKGWPSHSPIFQLPGSPELTVRGYVISLENELYQLHGKPYAELLKKSVLPNSWDESGPGRAAGLPGLIIVRQTPEGQKEVSEFLDRVIELPPSTQMGGGLF